MHKKTSPSWDSIRNDEVFTKFSCAFFESSLEHVISSCEQQVVDSLTKHSYDFTRYDDKVYLNLILCKDNSLEIFPFSIFNFLKRAKSNPLSKKRLNHIFLFQHLLHFCKQRHVFAEISLTKSWSWRLTWLFVTLDCMTNTISVSFRVFHYKNF